jgi:hypothetical protein
LVNLSKIFPILTFAENVELTLMQEIQERHREIPRFSAGENTDFSIMAAGGPKC